MNPKSAFYHGTTRYGGSSAVAKRQEAARKAFLTYKSTPRPGTSNDSVQSNSQFSVVSCKVDTIIQQPPKTPQLTSTAKKYLDLIEKNSLPRQDNYQFGKITNFRQRPRNRFNPMACGPTRVVAGPSKTVDVPIVIPTPAVAKPLVAEKIPVVAKAPVIARTIVIAPNSARFRSPTYRGIDKILYQPCSKKTLAAAKDLRPVKIEAIKTQTPMTPQTPQKPVINCERKIQIKEPEQRVTAKRRLEEESVVEQAEDHQFDKVNNSKRRAETSPKTIVPEPVKIVKSSLIPRLPQIPKPPQTLQIPQISQPPVVASVPIVAKVPVIAKTIVVAPKSDRFKSPHYIGIDKVATQLCGKKVLAVAKDLRPKEIEVVKTEASPKQPVIETEKNAPVTIEVAAPVKDVNEVSIQRDVDMDMEVEEVPTVTSANPSLPTTNAISSAFFVPPSPVTTPITNQPLPTTPTMIQPIPTTPTMIQPNPTTPTMIQPSFMTPVGLKGFSSSPAPVPTITTPTSNGANPFAPIMNTATRGRKILRPNRRLPRH